MRKLPLMIAVLPALGLASCGYNTLQTQDEQLKAAWSEVLNQYQLGRPKIDDGAILLVAKDDRPLRIEVGYGLEGALSDAVSKRIVGDVTAPGFRHGAFYGGISAGIDRMIGAIRGEPPPRAAAAGDNPDIRQFGPLLFIFALVVSVALRALFGRFPGAIVAAGVIGALAWWFVGALSIAISAASVAFLFTLLGRLGGIGGLRVGGRGGFGDDGGGFRGGGSFGGGGASGRW
jgi:uncharacterized protein